MAEEPREIKTAQGDVYFGTQRDGRPHGSGKLTLKDGDVYEGEFNDG